MGPLAAIGRRPGLSPHSPISFIGARMFAAFACREFADFVAPPRQRIRMFALQEANELLAQFGAEIGCIADCGRPDQNAQFDRLRTGIGNLHVH